MRWPHHVKLVNSPHMIHTECETLDDAIDILTYRRIVKERRRLHPRPLTLRQEFSLVKARQGRKPITLSDRVIQPKYQVGRSPAVPPPPKPPTMTAKRERARELYATGYWKPGEIAHEVGAECDKVKKWLKGMRLTR